MAENSEHLAAGGAQIFRGKLTAAIEPIDPGSYLDQGNSVTAKFMRWGKTPGKYFGLDRRGEFTAWDFTNTIYGKIGDLIWVIQTERGWEIIKLFRKKRQARLVLVTIVSDFTTSDATYSGTVSSSFDGPAPSSPITIANTGSVWAGTATKKALAFYDPDSDTYQTIWVECP